MLAKYIRNLNHAKPVMPVFDKVEFSEIENIRIKILSASTGAAKLALMKQFMALRGANSALEQNSDLEPDGKDNEVKSKRLTKPHSN
jgi:hypothetical protein